MKNTILIFCSWLGVDTNIGIFFRKQAVLVSEKYNPILVVFKKNYLSKNSINYKKSFKILEKKTKEELFVLEIFYPYSDKLPKKINIYFERKAVEFLSEYLMTKNIEVSFIHAHSLFDAGIWAFRYFAKFKTPYIVTEHNQLSFYNVSNDKCKLVKNALQNSTVNLVVSNDKIRQFVANGLFFDFENIGNLINNDFCYNEIDSKNRVKKIVTIGAFSPLKDQITILRALDIVDKNILKRIEFTWIGYDGWGGNHEKRVKELLSDFHFENIDVVLIPLLEHHEIAEYLQNSNLFLFSSLSEGMPVSVLEALASGLPVFTSSCGGVDEIINEENGKIYQIRDFQKLSELILDFLNNKIDYDGKRISENIIAKFGENVFREKLLSVYNRII